MQFTNREKTPLRQAMRLAAAISKTTTTALLIFAVLFSFSACDGTGNISTPAVSAQPSGDPGQSALPSLPPSAKPGQSVTPGNPSQDDPAPVPTDEPLIGLTAMEKFLRAYEMLSSVPYYRMEGVGGVKNKIATQDVLVAFEKDGERYKNESFSSGFVNKATLIEVSGGDISVKRGKNKGGIGEYGAPTPYTAEDFRSVWGGDAKAPWCYVVTEETVLNLTESRDGDHTVLKLELDPVSATREYVKRMAQNGGVETKSFEYVTLTFRLDKAGRFVSVRADERYTVSVKVTIAKINTTCDGWLNLTFTYE